MIRQKVLPRIRPLFSALLSLFIVVDSPLQAFASRIKRDRLIASSAMGAAAHLGLPAGAGGPVAVAPLAGRTVRIPDVSEESRPYLEAAARASERGDGKAAQLWRAGARLKNETGKEALAVRDLLRHYVYAALAGGLQSGEKSPEWIGRQERKLKTLGAAPGRRRELLSWTKSHLSAASWDERSRVRAVGALSELREFLGISRPLGVDELSRQADSVLARSGSDKKSVSKGPAGAASPSVSSRLSEEVERTRDNEDRINRELARHRLDRVVARLNGEDPRVLKEHDESIRRDLREFKKNRQRRYLLDKLSQRSDLRGGGGEEELRALDELLSVYDEIAHTPGLNASGMQDASELGRAETDYLKRRLSDMLSPEGIALPAQSDAPLAGTSKERDILEKVLSVERLKAQAQAQVAQRDAEANLLAVSDKMRGGALRRRRSERDMNEFRKNFSRLAIVMDLSYSLNVLRSAEQAIKGMQDLVDGKLKDIESQRSRSREGLEQARGRFGRGGEWEEDVKKKIADDEENEGLFTRLGEQAGLLVDRLDAYRIQAPAVFELIDARDRLQSADALSEYRRRLALLPLLRRYRRDGYPDDDGSVSKLSLRRLEEEASKVDGYIRDVEAGEGRFDGVPIEFAGVLIVAVPGIPSVSVANPDEAGALAILKDRKAFWSRQREDFQKLLDGVQASLGRGTSREIDDFGDSVPQSLVVYLKERQDAAQKAESDAQRAASEIDALAGKMRDGGAGSLPALAGQGLKSLRVLLPQYAERMDALSFPDNHEGTKAKIEKLGVARLLPALGDAVIRWAQAEATADVISDALEGVLPEARERFRDVLAAIDAVLSDADADEAFIRAGFPSAQAQALIDRKRRLVEAELKPMLLRMRSFLKDRMIPFQRDQIDSVSPDAGGDSLATLYEEKINLYERIRESYSETVPWSLASQGAPVGDSAAGRKAINEQREKFREYNQLLIDFLDEIKRRRDPDSAQTEEVYGETMPFSLVKRIAQYRAETVRRAGRINELSAQINGILRDIDARTAGRYGLAAAFRLPTGVSAPNAASATALRAIVDNGDIPRLADLLKRIADDALAASESAGGGLEIGGGESGIPTGERPPVELSPDQHLAVLALDAVKRLVPSTGASNNDSLTESVARYLFSDGVADASQESLDEQIPIFEVFLKRGEQALAKVFADLDADEGYVNSPGGSPDALFRRKIETFRFVRETAEDGARLFRQKIGWDRESFETVENIKSYYGSLEEIYDKSSQALDAEARAAQKYKEALQKALEPLLEQKKTVVDWLRQLNDPKESALRRVSENLSAVQEKTRAVLDANVHYGRTKKSYEAAGEKLKSTLKELEREQGALKDALQGVDLNDLSPRLAERVEGIGLGGPAWLAAGGRGPSSLIIKKTEFNNFLSLLFGSFEADSSARDMVRLREELLKNPLALAQLLPNARMLELGDDPNGFYLVYNTSFSTPHGLETESQVTLGNVLKLGENNVSLIGHRFASPPSSGNAPFGDQGVTVRVESLQGENWVNYLDVTFHKFIQDIPEELNAGSQVAESRMMVFEDFAVMLAGDKLYFGASGFGDFALQDAKNKPYYYGGNFKSSIKFNEIMSLSAEESLLFAKDPRRFLQTVNLDFTGFDPSFDRDYVVDARGENKKYRREKVGVGVDLQKALKTAGSFQLDFFGTNVAGTDDINQQTLGATILKGFEFNVGGVPARTEVSGTGELGTQYNTGSLRAGFELPDQGLVLSAQGKYLGDAKTYFLELKKKFGDNAELFASWGSRYVGLNHRLTLGVNSSYTLGQLWRSVAGHAAQDLLGGRSLERFNKDLVEFLDRSAADGELLMELKRVFESDVARRVISLEIGRLSRDIGELRKAGAILDNTRIRGMVGFVSNPVGTDTADRAAGGGFQVGTQTDLTMSKTQKALIHKRFASLFAGGLRLQVRLLEIAKRWQETVAEILDARWEAELATYMAVNAPDEATVKEGIALRVEAQGRLRQAQLRYNLLTGRSPDARLPFESANPQDMEALMGVLSGSLSNPERLSAMLAGLDPAELDAGGEPFNLMDWIPWIEGMTFSVGVQLHDILANQVLGAGVSLRLPIYDPHSGARDRALILEGEAILREMSDVYGAYRVRAVQEVQEAAAYETQVEYLSAQGPASAEALLDAISRYRNGMIGRDGLRGAFIRWHWTVTRLFDARAQAAMKRAWSLLDAAQGSPALPRWARADAPASPPARDLNSALENVRNNSRSLEALAKRSQAAAELLAAASHRIEKVTVDVHAGLNVTADGVGLIPALGMTGLGVYPILSVRMKPEELKVLETGRRGGEVRMAESLKKNLTADLSLQLFSAYAEYKGVMKTAAVLEYDVIPGLERSASGGDPLSILELSRARAQHAALVGEIRRLMVGLNYLLGRPDGAAIEITETPEEMLAGLLSRFQADSPLAAKRAVLEERIVVARNVETIVDKNLKVQDIRIEPISLIGRSLGRLVAALSGSGDASPELVAMARHQTLETERDRAAFEKNLPVLRARLAYQMRAIRRRLADIAYRQEAVYRIETVHLKTKLLQIQAEAALFGGSHQNAAPMSGLPGSFAELTNRLVAAMQAATPLPGAGANGDIVGAPIDHEAVTAQGTLRFYDARMSIGKDPIGRQFIEGWVEVRLNSRTTPPEALLALAGLQKERADQIHRAQLAQARGRAQMLAERLRLNSELLAWARAAEGVREDESWLGELERSVNKDVSEIAAYLNFSPDVTDQDVLNLIERSSDAGPQDMARRFLREARGINIAALRETLFESGLPPEFSSADSLVQLKSSVIAEKMSFKGFTPIGAFGMFRGRWVSGGFLEAPDPERIEKTLESILTDALRQELEAQDRLKSLALKLHSLMASVADKSRLLEARQAHWNSASEGLAGSLALFDRGDASGADVAASRRDAVAAWSGFLETATALRMDFVALVTELKALGQPARGALGIAARPAARASHDAGEGLEDLARYVSRRFSNEDFSAALESLFDGSGVLSKEQAKRLSRMGRAYREVVAAADAARYHEFDPQERLEILTHLDVEGRRLAIEREFLNVLRGLRSGADASGEPFGRLREFLLRDLSSDVEVKQDRVRTDRHRTSLMRRALWDGGGVAPSLKDTMDGLEAMRLAAEEARGRLLDGYLDARRRPEDFILRDKALDEYLKKQILFDGAVIAAFASSAVRSTPNAAKTLDYVFSLRESVARRKTQLRRGRAVLAAEALIGVEEAQLNALKWRGAPPDEKAEAARRLAFLTALRDRWIARPETIRSVYAVVDREDSVERWLTGEDIEGLKRAGRIVVSEGRRWWIPAHMAGMRNKNTAELRAKGAREILAGSDALSDELDRTRDAASRERGRRLVLAALAESEFVTVDETGEPAGRLDLETLRRLESEGRVLYFSNKADRTTGLHEVLHPMAARRKTPGEMTVLVSDAPVTFGRFPTLESVRNSPQSADFRDVRTGKKGLIRLVAEAQTRAGRSRRLGWISMKLDSYGFALDARGEVAGVYLNAEEFAAARSEAREDEAETAETFYSSADLAWGLDSEGRLCDVSIAETDFRRSFGCPAVSQVTGDVLAAELNSKGAVVRYFQDKEKLDRLSSGWWIEDMSGRIWKQADFLISPTLRLKRYIDPQTRLPVLLGRTILQRRRDEAQEELGDVARWAYMPWNWANIVLETPRGIVKTPIEIITGRDPNQHGYIGRVYMYRGEGGATVRRSGFGKIVHFMDIFELLPDPVDRYMDPSQFPEVVENDSALKPGEWEHEKNPRTPDRNIHMGKGTLLRYLRYADEDLEDARGRILGAFQGGVRKTTVEAVRGRAGLYPNARVEHSVGAEAVDRVLGEMGAFVGSEGDGDWEADPGHIEVDRVRAETQVRLGARQYEDRVLRLRSELKSSQTPDARDPEQFVSEIARLERDAELFRRRRESVRAMAQVGPPLRSVLAQSAFPYLTLGRKW